MPTEYWTSGYNKERAERDKKLRRAWEKYYDSRYSNIGGRSKFIRYKVGTGKFPPSI
jgi:hypothetical protein